MSTDEVTLEANGKSVSMTGDEFSRTTQRITRGVLGPVPDEEVVAENKYYRVGQEVLELCQQLIDEHHPDLRHARIGLLFRSGSWKSRGRETWGKAAKVSDKVRAIAGDLDFLITLNEEVWNDRLSPLQRKALLDHELCHCEFDRHELKASIRGHDVEEFKVIIRRYGAWKDDVRGMEEAFNHHEQLHLALDEEPRGKVVAVEPAGEEPDLVRNFRDFDEEAAAGEEPDPQKHLEDEVADEFRQQGILEES